MIERLNIYVWPFILPKTKYSMQQKTIRRQKANCNLCSIYIMVIDACGWNPNWGGHQSLIISEPWEKYPLSQGLFKPRIIGEGGRINYLVSLCFRCWIIYLRDLIPHSLHIILPLITTSSLVRHTCSSMDRITKSSRYKCNTLDYPTPMDDVFYAPDDLFVSIRLGTVILSVCCCFLRH